MLSYGFSVAPSGLCIESRPRLSNHLGTEGAIGKRSLALPNLRKVRIDPLESRAHLGMTGIADA